MAIPGRAAVRLHHDFCFVLFADWRNGSLAGPAGQNFYRWIGCDYDAAFLLLRLCGFSRLIFFDVLSSAFGYSSHVSRPGIALDFPRIRSASGLGILSCRRAISHAVDELPVSIARKFAEHTYHERNPSSSVFLDRRCAGLWPPRRDYFSGVVATGPGKVELPGVALPAAADAGSRSRAPASEYVRTRPGITPR